MFYIPRIPGLHSILPAGRMRPAKLFIAAVKMVSCDLMHFFSNPCLSFSDVMSDAIIVCMCVKLEQACCQPKGNKIKLGARSSR